MGWRKLKSLNLIIMQNAINKLCSDNARKNTKKILVDMLEKAVDTDLLTKNVAKKPKIEVRHTLCYFSKNGKYVFEMHDTKTNNGKRTIPLTEKAIKALKKQKIQKQEIVFKGKIAPDEYSDLVFVTSKIIRTRTDSVDYEFVLSCYRGHVNRRDEENEVKMCLKTKWCQSGVKWHFLNKLKRL